MFESLLKIAGWAILFSVVGLLIWLSPIGRLIDEFEEFRKSKRDQQK